jgi:pyridoxal phosphate enzyme (YggS family)
VDDAVSELTASVIGDRLDALRDRIRTAGGDDGVVVVGVTKGHPASAVRAAIAAGIDQIGESYAQEWAAKSAELGDVVGGPGVVRHFIGQLQTNKVRLVAPIVDVFQTVDRSSLVDALATRAPGAHVMVQVDLAGAPGRGGVAFESAPALVTQATDAGLVVDGLMGVAPLPDPDDRAASRRGFERLRALRDELGLRSLSIGMSDDLEEAVAAGSTMVRIGTGLFGPRSP